MEEVKHSKFDVYLRLLRLREPTGIWLLLWPCWWSVALASHDFPSFHLLALFAVGAVLMRSAGCIVNDIIDREFDKKVERTKTRPLASGEISPADAVLILVILLCMSLLVAWQMDPLVLELATVSLVLVAAYPFMKRLTWWPQAFLGLTFNWGALLGWAAVKGALGAPAFLLYLGGVFWTLGYDTIYAHQDKTDDALIGVKSTALKLGAQTKDWMVGFYTAAVLCWVAAGAINGNGLAYVTGLFLVGGHFIVQVKNVHLDDTASCLQTFRSNRAVGVLFFLAILVDTFFVAR